MTFFAFYLLFLLIAKCYFMTDSGILHTYILGRFNFLENFGLDLLTILWLDAVEKL